MVRYFHPLPAEGKSCDFTLLRRAGDDSRYGFIAIADPQIWAPKEFAKLAAAADDIATPRTRIGYISDKSTHTTAQTEMAQQKI